MRKITALLLALCVLCLCACTSSPAPKTLELFAMDTYMTLQVYGDEAVLSALSQKINVLDRLLSATNEAGQLYALNQTGRVSCDRELTALLTDSLALSARTDGALDVTVYPAVMLWGFPTDDYRVPTDAELSEALSHIGADHVQLSGDAVNLDQGTMLDFGAVAKGYAARACLELLEASDASAAILSLGGNIQTYGSKPGGDWLIGITDPTGETDYFATLSLSGTHAIVTSGSYQRYFEQDGKRYHHILVPKTGEPAETGLLSVTVVCDDALTADGLSTALFVMGLEKASDFYRDSDDFEAVFYSENGTVYVTEGLTNAYRGTDYEVIAR
ncbi:MAG: FAD:protein FMN transferase [Clostridia bacterium]|nr:FAD:protein FMN transferase [Clostridia bacterium]